MRISKYGHSCLHVVDGSASILIDPGTLSQGFETLSGLTAVLVTHQHPDHVDPQRLPGLLRANPGATLYADTGSVGVLADAGVTATPVATGDVLDVGTTVEVRSGDHAIVHRDIPVIPNATYLIGGRLFHPGDSLTVPDRQVDILALPTSAPWMARQGGDRLLPGGQPRGRHPHPREVDGQHRPMCTTCSASSGRPGASGSAWTMGISKTCDGSVSVNRLLTRPAR